MKEVDRALAQALSAMDSADIADVLVDQLLTFAESFGVTHVLLLRSGVLGELDRERDVLGVTPSDFVEPFLCNRTFFEDALVASVCERQAFAFWNDQSPWAGRTSHEMALKVVLERSGLTGGLAVPALGGAGLILLAGCDVHLEDTVTAYLKLLSVYAFDRAVMLQRRSMRRNYGLSVREYECLRWCAAGKTDWEIGQILSISPKTVNYHIENAKRKMGVQTRVQAVVAALLAGGLDC